VLRLGERHDMQDRPDEPGDDPAHAQTPALQYGEILSDNGHVALVEISKRPLWLVSPELARDQAPDISSLLDCGLGHDGHGPPIVHDRRCIADHEHIGDARHIHGWADRYPPGAVG